MGPHLILRAWAAKMCSAMEPVVLVPSKYLVLLMSKILIIPIMQLVPMVRLFRAQFRTLAQTKWSKWSPEQLILRKHLKPLAIMLLLSLPGRRETVVNYQVIIESSLSSSKSLQRVLLPGPLWINEIWRCMQRQQQQIRIRCIMA